MNTIHTLPIEEIKFVKTISFNVELFGRIYSGKIVYKRNPTSTYHMDETKRSTFDRMMCHYPEECYPNDIIDKIILEGVKDKYPTGRIRTKLMLCDIEKENIIKPT